MKRVAVVGASGYAGAELCRIISGHSGLELTGMYVSEGSADKGKALSELYGALSGRVDGTLEATPDAQTLAKNCDAVFLATDHKVSHDLAGALVPLGVAVFDLSGAFRLQDLKVFAKAYGFEHQYPELVKQAVYALPEFTDVALLRKTKMISLPGCYPTASQLALKPLIEAGALDLEFRPVIDAVSGVTGSGRKARLTNSFCEVSLNAYGVFTHRHQPEIAEHLGTEVIFTPHLGPYKRGILATITAKLKAGFDSARVAEIYSKAYADKPLVRLKSGMPKLMDVQGLPFCDLGFKVAEDGSGYIVIGSAIDNLLKGAAAQAVQALNLYYGFDETAGLL